METSIYQTPKSELENQIDVKNDSELASRWSRLGASLVDTIVMFIFMIPAMYFFGWFEIISSGKQPPILYSLLFGLAGIILFLVINYKFLKNDGQTVGKKVASIKIVASDGAKAEMSNHIIKRYLTYFVPNHIPVIGSFLGFINILFIFRKDKKCIHDLIGGTKVIRS